MAYRVQRRGKWYIVGNDGHMRLESDVAPEKKKAAPIVKKTVEVKKKSTLRTEKSEVKKNDSTAA